MTDAKTRPTAGETAVLEKVEEWSPALRPVGRRLHEIIMENAPGLRAKLWYGQPGYSAGGPVLCFFRVDDGNLTFGITEKADTAVADDATDQLVEAAWFVHGLDDATEERVATIVRRAVG